MSVKLSVIVHSPPPPPFFFFCVCVCVTGILYCMLKVVGFFVCLCVVVVVVFVVVFWCVFVFDTLFGHD